LLVFMSVTTLCFFIQWVIWSQLILIVWRRVVQRKRFL
jgi:hypothetical protein